MTSRNVLATNRAIALQTIEANLPPKFVESLSNNPEVRQVAILEYLAAAFEKRSNKAEEKQKLQHETPEPQPEPEPEPQPPPEKTRSK